MNILFIDSATEACTAALWHNGTVLSAFELAPKAHTHRLLPMAEQLLSEAGIDYNQLDLIAYGRGPGSFTGVRIATACAQGMALGLDIPVLGISSLATLAQALREQAFQAGGGIIHAALDARMGEIYYGRYLVDDAGSVTPLGEERVISPDLILSEFEIHSENSESEFATGSGFARYPALISANSWRNTSPDALPDARFAIELAAATSTSQWHDPADAAPIYLRDNVAQVKDAAPITG
ncbi:MAG: tRNA (adenosine(37)-N6)-threonylcarbamoyltransferase complex dimerization subunit type 1 TsaB [Halothiobacillus sp. 14-56-357]|uniref:tRNA (adenosine(37)-N6)-threonylcarbamoyltransferase complex dimerization subunit type 1 TsaB n=1 Tax=Halothiobacillus sp. 15-55-196 TaxID=1970382 RepID=UPI000BDB7597|nr:tRNA (adenosine(37)-N6)-threonylcarbamoyltransferase complex dimerization subunit type 1 TsaB [Halothiobacillus sp. 15-55-196]OZB37286.1 MAG: tRNA (adenosine(37)-N6)-threonylcarbamoyltransferase complex dimerization subunit type 1 TsaB [Halothiobacillus sp. 15-55-196]OZB56479.1 MAG: tRNA (adenosine(37)-N6)-threonylcarbamoyltransferase complex dimerization subunit type 1 TsaB [Halothiobacillus sp. 14-56-357]OZB78439.1 MAG: tRNA (adenosine(37)-N6)-threonylcarbamoyltransferase complex dimerizati